MKLKTTLELVLSVDNATTPTQIRFSEDLTDSETTLISESITRNESFPIGTNIINMGTIAAGKFLYLKSNQALDLDIDGEVLSVLANKPIMLWVDFAAISLITSQVSIVSLVVGGA